MRALRFSELPPEAREAIRKALLSEDTPKAQRTRKVPRLWRKPVKVPIRFVYRDRPISFRGVLLDMGVYGLCSLLWAVLISIVWRQIHWG
jgi:hypothetical protein